MHATFDPVLALVLAVFGTLAGFVFGVWVGQQIGLYRAIRILDDRIAAAKRTNQDNGGGHG